MYTFKITYIFIIHNLNTFSSYISISVHSTLFNLWFFSYIGVILHPCYSYVCLYYHACLHYLNKKWSDKDTDCTCCVYCILKCVHSWNHKNLSFPWIYDMFNCFWRLYPVNTSRPAGGMLDSFKKVNMNIDAWHCVIQVRPKQLWMNTVEKVSI